MGFSLKIIFLTRSQSFSLWGLNIYFSFDILNKNDKAPQFSVSLLYHREIKIVKILKGLPRYYSPKARVGKVERAWNRDCSHSIYPVPPLGL